MSFIGSENMKNGVIKMTNGVKTQFAKELTYGEALRLVGKLREKRDGCYYWIGNL